MTYVSTALRTALVLFSTLGWVHTVSKKLQPAFAPGVAFASIGSVMFFAGILNLLPETAWLLCLGGAALVLRAIKKKESFRPLLCPAAIFFLACAGLMLYLLCGQKFTHYDNFTHWGVVTRQMLRTDRFPNFLDRFVMHQSYPLGSASFIYYFCYLTGQHAEWVQMFVQALLIIGLLTCLFAFARRPLPIALTAAAALIMMFDKDDLYNTLLVDVLLGAAAAGGITLCIFYRDRLEQMLLWTIPYTVFLTAVKNSGLLFAVYIVVYLLIYVRKKRHTLPKLALCAFAPLATLLLWQKHVKLVFQHGMEAKHSLSLTNFLSTVSEKSPDDIHQIASSFLQTVFSPSNEMLWVLIMLAALYLLVRFVLRQPLRSFWHTAALIVLSYAVYICGLYLTYLLTMPLWEALALAGYPRYHMTILMFEAAILLVYAVGCMEKLPAAGKAGAAAAAEAALLLVVCVQALNPHVFPIRRIDGSGTPRYILENLIEQYQIPSGKRYAIVVKEDLNDTGYTSNLTQYLLEPESYTLMAPSYLMPRRGALMMYDYLIVLDDTEQSRALMERFYSDPDLRMVKLDSPAS